ADRFGATPPLARAGDVAAALQQLLQESGYLKATVTPAPAMLEHEPERATMVFDVVAGPRARIEQAKVTGNPLEPVDRVQARLRVAPGEPYQPGDLRARLDEYVAWMRKRGYYEADAREETARFNADRTTVDVAVDVRPGPLVKVQFV